MNLIQLRKAIRLSYTKVRHFSNSNKAKDTLVNDKIDPLKERQLNSINGKETSEFLKNLRNTEKSVKKQNPSSTIKDFIKNSKIPLAILLSSGITYILWKSFKYRDIYRHLTVNEKTIDENTWYDLLLSSVSFKTTGQLLTYGIPMALALSALPKKLRTRHFLTTFVLNSAICGLSTILYEKNFSFSKDKLMIPKTGGCTTSLMYMTLFSTLMPSFGFFGFRYLPFFSIPIMFFFYEYYEMKETIVHEISRPSHLIAMFNGIVFGLYLRRFGRLSNL